MLVPLKLGNLPLLPLVVHFKLLHQLLVRLEQSRILDEGRNLVALVGLCFVLSGGHVGLPLIQVVR